MAGFAISSVFSQADKSVGWVPLIPIILGVQLLLCWIFSALHELK
jgi:hypothetical protein